MISLKTAREQQGLTIDDLAALSGVSAAKIAAIEAGEERATFTEAAKISRALGVTIKSISEFSVIQGGAFGRAVQPLLGPKVSH